MEHLASYFGTYGGAFLQVWSSFGGLSQRNGLSSGCWKHWSGSSSPFERAAGKIRSALILQLLPGTRSLRLCYRDYRLL